MKKWLYAVGITLTFASSIIAQATDRIAVVNLSSVFQQSSQRALVTKQLEDEFKGRATELQSMERDLQNKIEDLHRNGSTMEASERNLLENAMLIQREAFSTKAQEFEQDNRRRQIEEHNKILTYIRNVVKNIALKEGYDVVIDTNAIAYVSNAKDITSKVLKQVK